MVPLATETFDRKLKAESCTEYFDRLYKEINDSPYTGMTSLYRLLSDFSVFSLLTRSHQGRLLFSIAFAQCETSTSTEDGLVYEHKKWILEAFTLVDQKIIWFFIEQR